jgi:two-component sensor histidine kinase
MFPCRLCDSDQLAVDDPRPGARVRKANLGAVASKKQQSHARRSNTAAAGKSIVATVTDRPVDGSVYRRHCKEGPLAATAPRERSLAGSDLLLAELLHRINNELGCVVSIMSRTAARTGNDEVKATLGMLTDRVMAVSCLHRALQMPSESVEIDASAYLRDICEAISRSKLGDNGIRLAFVDRPLAMNAIRCWRLGLIVCELVTNSIRHAFGDQTGLIRVELRASDSLVECRVADNGRGNIPIRRGRGLTIVESLVGTLGASIEYLAGEHGSAVVVILPRRASDAAGSAATIDVSATLQ